MIRVLFVVVVRIVAQHLGVFEVELLDEEVPEELVLEHVALDGLALVGEMACPR